MNLLTSLSLSIPISKVVTLIVPLQRVIVRFKESVENTQLRALNCVISKLALTVHLDVPQVVPTNATCSKLKSSSRPPDVFLLKKFLDGDFIEFFKKPTCLC